MKKLRVGLVGLGGMGGIHKSSYVANPEAEIVAVCDILPNKVDQYVNDLGLDASKGYLDFRAMIDNEELDAVDICTPNDFHSIIAVYALEHGLHVFSEKPDAVSVEEAEKMKAAAEANDRVLMVMRNNRYYSNSVYLKNYINTGAAGDIYCGRCGWIRRRGIPGKGGWFTTKAKSGGGPLIDLGVHMIDLAIWLMGNPTPVAVSGCTYMKFADNTADSDSEHSAFGNKMDADGTFDVEDLAMGMIRFDNGACLQIEFSWASNIAQETRFVELRGTKAGMSWKDDGSAEIYSESADGKLTDDIHRTSNMGNGHDAAIRHFVDIVLHDAKKDYVPKQGLDMIKILCAIYKSAETGKEVQL